MRLKVCMNECLINYYYPLKIVCEMLIQAKKKKYVPNTKLTEKDTAKKTNWKN